MSKFFKDFSQSKGNLPKVQKHEKKRLILGQKPVFGNKSEFNSVSRPKTVLYRFSGQKYVI
jgi:hypothetical protein